MIPELSELHSHDPEKYALLAELPWVQDGIIAFEPYVTSAAESRTIEYLTEAASLDDDRVFYGLLNKPWLRDQVTADESLAIRYLVGITRDRWSRPDSDSEWLVEEGNSEFAMRVLGMPFLDTFEVHDTYAIGSLYFLRFVDNRYLEQVLDHPSFHGGITGTDTAILTGLRMLARRSPENLDNLMAILDPGSVYVDRRTIELPLAGEITLTIVRLTPGEFQTMDMMEEIVREQESFMNVPHPYNVTVFNIDPGRPGGAARHGVITISTGLEESFFLLTHELAHSYWTNPATWSLGVDHKPFVWIEEGAAVFMDLWAVDRRRIYGLDKAPSSPGETSCIADRISELDQKAYDGDFEFWCQPTLGSGMFAALYNELGDAEFRRGFRSLYLKISRQEHDAACTGVERGVCYVKKAFVEDASPGFAGAAGVVIDRWYYGDE